MKGLCCYTSNGQTEGDKLADCLCRVAKEILSSHIRGSFPHHSKAPALHHCVRAYFSPIIRI